MVKQLEIIKPDDWHLHLRDNQTLATTVANASAPLKRAIIMPNLSLPIAAVSQANAYKKRILGPVPKGESFQPLMTLYLTQDLTPKDIATAKKAGIVAIKYYPRHATTNSSAGVLDLKKLNGYTRSDGCTQHAVAMPW